MADKDDWEPMLDELFDLDSGLTGWEIDFLDSLDNLREQSLSPNQFAKLEQIYNRLKG